MSAPGTPTDLTRRQFLGTTLLGTAGGAAALGLLESSPSPAQPRANPAVLRDYVGRLCYNENPLGPSPSALSAIHDSANMAHRYPDWYAESLRGDLAAAHGVGTSQTIAGCGATEILRLCALAFADPSGNVVCPYPSYGQFPSDANFLGATVRYSDLDSNYRIDLADMASQVDGQTSAVCITNPNNPTGTVLAAADIAAFVDSLPSQVVTIIDEAYHEYVHAPSYASAMELVRQGKKVMVIRTLSKVYGLAGARIGYAVGLAAEVGAMSAWHLYATVSRLSAEAARAALGDNQHIANTVLLNDQAKQYCFDNFGPMGLEYIPSETNFFMVDVGVPASQVADELAARGILVRTGWGMPQHLRVSTGTTEEMQSFIAALADILGTSGVTAAVAPRVTALSGNYPNPFRTTTHGTYSIASAGHVRLQVFNVQGQLIRTVVDWYRPAGRYDFDWDGTNQRGEPVACGSYFHRLTFGDVSQTRRMILLR